MDINGDGGVILYLSEVKKGQVFKIVDIPDKEIRAQAIRFGITEGETLDCEEIIPAGPVIIKKKEQEIAIGRGLADTILIELV